MSQKTHSQDSNFILSEDDVKLLNFGPQPWLPHQVIKYQELKKSIQAYKEAAVSDEYMFGDYDGYQAYRDVE